MSKVFQKWAGKKPANTANYVKQSPTAAQVYEKLPPALQEAAWSVTLQRLTYTDPQAGKDWLEQHAGDPGHNYQETQRNAGFAPFPALRSSHEQAIP